MGTEVTECVDARWEGTSHLLCEEDEDSGRISWHSIKVNFSLLATGCGDSVNLIRLGFLLHPKLTRLPKFLKLVLFVFLPVTFSMYMSGNAIPHIREWDMVTRSTEQTADFLPGIHGPLESGSNSLHTS